MYIFDHRDKRFNQNLNNQDPNNWHFMYNTEIKFALKAKR